MHCFSQVNSAMLLKKYVFITVFILQAVHKNPYCIHLPRSQKPTSPVSSTPPPPPPPAPLSRIHLISPICNVDYSTVSVTEHKSRRSSKTIRSGASFRCSFGRLSPCYMKLQRILQRILPTERDIFLLFCWFFEFII